MVDSFAGAAGRIFISYRRQDTAYPAGWLYDRLANQYGGEQVFKDVDSIELGDDFVQVITRAVGSCDVLLALIGEQWLTITDEHGRQRLHDPDDFVRLEVETALMRDVRVIPILVDGARMPRADELPPGLVPLGRRQALELSPHRFEYDTSRLLKVLDATLAEVRSAHEHAAARSSSAVCAAEARAVPKQVARPRQEFVQGETEKPASSEEGPSRTKVILPSRTRGLRRRLMIGVSLAALVATFLTAKLLLDRHTFSNDTGASSSATGQFTEKGPWRLAIRGKGNIACTITLYNLDRRETWSNPDPVYSFASFLRPDGGTFRWSIEPGCSAESRPGPGNLPLPAEVDGVGTSDAFEAPALVAVTVKDFHSNERCHLELLDVATGTVVDSGDLDQQHRSLTLQPFGRSLVYLNNDMCLVRVPAG
jgi:hypothetical protein